MNTHTLAFKCVRAEEMHAYMYTYTCVHMHPHAHKHACLHMCVYVCTHTQIMHTYEAWGTCDALPPSSGRLEFPSDEREEEMHTYTHICMHHIHSQTQVHADAHMHTHNPPPPLPPPFTHTHTPARACMQFATDQNCSAVFLRIIFHLIHVSTFSCSDNNGFLLWNHYCMWQNQKPNEGKTLEDFLNEPEQATNPAHRLEVSAAVLGTAVFLRAYEIPSFHNGFEGRVEGGGGGGGGRSVWSKRSHLPNLICSQMNLTCFCTAYPSIDNMSGGFKSPVVG